MCCSVALVLLVASASSVAAVPPGQTRLTATPANFTAAGNAALTAELETGFCVGERFRPYIEKVGIRWSKLGDGRYEATLTAWVRSPVEELVVDPDPNDDVIYGVCLGVGVGLHRTVRLPQPLHTIELYDGAFSPPRRRPICLARDAAPAPAPDQTRCPKGTLSEGRPQAAGS